MLDSTDPISQMAGEDSQFQQKMAIVELLDEENILIPSWICFSTIDGENVPSGDNFKDCLDIINRSKRVGAAGVNCAAPRFIEGLICKFEKLTDKAIAVYPNSGETWDAKAKF